MEAVGGRAAQTFEVDDGHRKRVIGARGVLLGVVEQARFLAPSWTRCRGRLRFLASIRPGDNGGSREVRGKRGGTALPGLIVIHVDDIDVSSTEWVGTVFIDEVKIQ